MKNKLLITILLFLSIVSHFSCRKTEPKVSENNTTKSLDYIKSESKDNFNKAQSVLKHYKQVDYVDRKDDEFIYQDIIVDFSFNVDLQKTSLKIIKENKVGFSRFLNDNFDNGNLHLWRYQNQKDNIFLMELDDYYGSVFFIYGFSNDCLFRLGDFVIAQPNVERDGVKQKSFKISEQDNTITIEQFLDKKPLSKLEISSKKDCVKSNQKILYAQVETYLNVRSVPNSSGSIIAKAYPKDALRVLEVLEGWVKIELNGKEGYVSKDFVK
ncbi:SH3 domain-containing protein [Cellulophaga sp. E6(2014)]|uniref:SH3 domain-containing protein n=1 Tax=Cellulophaga sp. E6(2014) TaxID=1495334 RepID=UPI00051DA5CE|nr:SH3 domain-containing protein [Cellulophaga sp. E6(2014)]KGK30887.1 hypothetical protein EL45_08235 [Cellulophaga sp. E6(2014)]